MKFAWVDSKAGLNKKEAGISFEEAQTVFEYCEAPRIFEPNTTEKMIKHP